MLCWMRTDRYSAGFPSANRRHSTRAVLKRIPFNLSHDAVLLYCSLFSFIYISMLAKTKVDHWPNLKRNPSQVQHDDPLTYADSGAALRPNKWLWWHTFFHTAIARHVIPSFTSVCPSRETSPFGLATSVNGQSPAASFCHFSHMLFHHLIFGQGQDLKSFTVCCARSAD